MQLDAKHTINCIGCQPSDPLLTIQSTEYGRVILRIDDQGPLGRSIYVPHEHIYDTSLLHGHKSPVLLDAYKCASQLSTALETLYGCSKIAVCMIGNLTRDEKGEITDDIRYEHRHFHLIPSYHSPVQRYGVTFVDDNYGKPMNLDEHRGYKKQPVSKQLAELIVKDISKQMKLQ